MFKKYVLPHAIIVIYYNYRDTLMIKRIILTIFCTTSLALLPAAKRQRSVSLDGEGLTTADTRAIKMIKLAIDHNGYRNIPEALRLAVDPAETGAAVAARATPQPTA